MDMGLDKKKGEITVKLGARIYTVSELYEATRTAIHFQTALIKIQGSLHEAIDVIGAFQSDISEQATCSEEKQDYDETCPVCRLDKGLEAIGDALVETDLALKRRIET